jgi:hypothetical protein
MNSEQNPSIFGKIGIADFFALLLGAGTFSNVAMLFSRDPQTVVIIGYSAMILGALATRYVMVSMVGYINTQFGAHEKRGVLIKSGYAICFFVLVVAYVFSKIVLDEHIGG